MLAFVEASTLAQARDAKVGAYFRALVATFPLLVSVSVTDDSPKARTTRKLINQSVHFIGEALLVGGPEARSEPILHRGRGRTRKHFSFQPFVLQLQCVILQVGRWIEECCASPELR